MKTPLQFGRIVWVEIADANKIGKLRPAVVVTPSEQITAAGPVQVVAVTSRLDRPLPADQVLLPWHPQGHPRTKLNRPSAAVCSWLAQVLPGDIQDFGGLVPGPLMLGIVSRIPAPEPEPPVTNPPPENNPPAPEA